MSRTVATNINSTMVTENTPISVGVSKRAITIDDSTAISKLAYRSRKEKNKDRRVDMVQRESVADRSAAVACSNNSASACDRPRRDACSTASACGKTDLP